MRLSIAEDYGDGVLTKDHKVLLNGKEVEDVVRANDLLGYVDTWFPEYELNGEKIRTKRKFGSIIFLYKGKRIMDKASWQ